MLQICVNTDRELATKLFCSKNSKQENVKSLYNLLTGGLEQTLDGWGRVAMPS